MPVQRKTLYTVLIAVLVLGLVLFAWQNFSLRKQLQTAQKAVSGRTVNKKVLAFSELFVTDILQSGQTVSFDQRLALENAVRDINDPEIYAAWQKFTKSKDQDETQQNFYVLFSLLLKKISP